MFQKGDAVRIIYQGRSINGTVEIASPNGRSLFLSFEGVLGGFIQGMPVLLDEEGEYRNLITHDIVKVSSRSGVGIRGSA